MRGKWTAAVAFAAAGVLALSACSSSKSNKPSGTSPGNNTGAVTDSKVEVFSWWTGGGEAAGLQALIADYKKKNSGVDFVNAAVAGGAGTNAKAVLQSRLKANTPPDSFQGHAGAELQDYIKAGQVEPLDDFYKQQGLDKAFPQSLIDEISYKGHVYSVPANIHRANVLWFNPNVVQKAGITAAPTTVAEFIADLDKVKQTQPDVLPISVGDQWTTEHLWETVMIGDLGADGWNNLWKSGANWSDPKVTQAINDFKKIMTYVPTSSYAADWQTASKAVIDGKAAYNVMGDWAVAEFTAKGKKDGVDYSYWAVPGQDGVYDFLADSFTLPKGAKNPNGAKDWLRTIGSAEGQKAFNLAKGSIPARTDIAKDGFPPYQQWAMDQFKSAKVVSSIAHGAAVPSAWSTAIQQAMSKYMSTKDAAAFQADLVTAAADGLGG